MRDNYYLAHGLSRHVSHLLLACCQYLLFTQIPSRPKELEFYCQCSFGFFDHNKLLCCAYRRCFWLLDGGYLRVWYGNQKLKLNIIFQCILAIWKHGKFTSYCEEISWGGGLGVVRSGHQNKNVARPVFWTKHIEMN